MGEVWYSNKSGGENMTSLIPNDSPESPEPFFIEVIRRLMRIVDKNIDDITALEKRVKELEDK